MMKPAIFKIRTLNKYFLIGVVCVGFLIAIQSCIDSIAPKEPLSVNAGSNLTITMPTVVSNGALGPVTDNLIVAFLVPKKWNATKPGNTTMTYTSDLQNGNGVLVPMPSTTTVPNSSFAGYNYPDYFKAQYGAGNNGVDDHEWIVYKTDKQFTLNVGQKVNAVITITTKAGTQNMLTKFGYVVTYDGAGAVRDGNDSKYQLDTACFEVVNGTNPIIDLCNKPLTTVLPLSALDKDFITFTYDNDLRSTPLQGTTEIYLSAKATTTDNKVIDFSTKLTPFVALGNQQYTLVMYPRLYFNLQPNQSLSAINYYITNKTGTKAVTAADSQPFNYTFSTCQ